MTMLTLTELNQAKNETKSFFNYFELAVANGGSFDEVVNKIITKDLDGEDPFRQQVRREFLKLVEQKRSKLNRKSKTTKEENDAM